MRLSVGFAGQDLGLGSRVDSWVDAPWRLWFVAQNREPP